MQELMEVIWNSNLGLMILAGDFNSLKREDYNLEQWEEISEVIRKSCSPQFHTIPISGEEVKLLGSATDRSDQDDGKEELHRLLERCGAIFKEWSDCHVQVKS